MEAIIDGFFSGYEFGSVGDGARLAYEHYDAVSDVAVFGADAARLEDVEPLVATAIEMLARSYPECATVQYRIDPRG